MIEITKADLTTLTVDAIVNAANAALSGGGGVDGAIHRAAGPELLAACRALGRCPVGDAVVTPGFRLPVRYVIHAVGPVWDGGTRGESVLLARVYERSFARAKEHGVRSIAFPAISTGAYRFPGERAAEIALEAMLAHEPEFDRIVACVFDEATLAEYERTLSRLRSAKQHESDQPRQTFIAFLLRLANGTSTREDWATYVVNHSPDAALEAARIELVRGAIAAGEWSWPDVPQVLRGTAHELHARLRSARG